MSEVLRELQAERERLYLSIMRLYRWPRSVVLTDEQRERRAGKLMDRASALQEREWELRKREAMLRVLAELESAQQKEGGDMSPEDNA